MQTGPSIRKLMTDEDQQSWQDTVSKLKFIASIKEGQKIDIGSVSIMSNNYWTSAWRTWRTMMSCPESRNETIKWIRQVTGEAFTLCEQYATIKEDFYHKLAANIGDDIQSAIAGILNLRRTYSDDAIFTSKIDSQIVLMKEKIDQLATQFPNIIILKPDEV